MKVGETVVQENGLKIQKLSQGAMGEPKQKPVPKSEGFARMMLSACEIGDEVCICTHYGDIVGELVEVDSDAIMVHNEAGVVVHIVPIRSIISVSICFAEVGGQQ